MGTQVLCLGILTLDHGCVTPGSGSGNCARLTQGVVCLEVGHPGDYRCVTADAGSVRGATPETADI